MAQRLIGEDVALFKVDSNSPPTEDYLGRLRSVEIQFDMDTQENQALKDTYHYHEAIRQDWRIMFSISPRDDVYPEVLTHMAAGTTVNVKGQLAPNETHAVAFAAVGMIKSSRYSVGDGPQELSLEIWPRGLLTFSAGEDLA